ncbi:c-type cytochrome [Mesorhizobium hawassense]|nr:cytochrome c [Mesorhizobium hawassense]
MAVFAGGPSAWAQENPQIAHGRKLVEANCARCHAIGSTGKSTHPDAPPFRLLHLRYPIEDLEEALAEGISTGHPDMPEFVADPQQIGAIVAYIRSLSR